MERYNKIKKIAQHIVDFYNSEGKYCNSIPENLTEAENHYRVLEEIITEGDLMTSISLYGIVVHLDTKYKYPVFHGKLLTYLNTAYNQWGDVTLKIDAQPYKYTQHYVRPSFLNIPADFPLKNKSPNF